MSQITLQTLDFSSLGFPSVGEFYLGVDVDGIPKLRRANDTIPLYATSSSTLQYITTNVSDFINLINTSSLNPGSVYLITDFQTQHYIQYTDSNGDGTALDELVNVADPEPLVIVAISNSQYNIDVKSLTYPDDTIIWRHNLVDREKEYFNPSGLGKGYITYRKSASENSRDYDFRGVVFWRWNDGSGNYTIVRRVDAPNIFDYKVCKAFEEGWIDPFIKNVIGSVNTSNVGLSVPYYLDNLVISTFSSAVSNKINLAHGVTINTPSFAENEIGVFTYTTVNDTTSEFIFNKIHSLDNSNIIGDFKSNNCVSVYGNTFSNTFSTNKISILADCIIGFAIGNNIVQVDNCQIQTFNLNNGNLLSDSFINVFEFNNFNVVDLSSITSFTYNDVNQVSNNTIGTVSGNIVNTIIGNTCSQINENISVEIKDNIVPNIYNNTIDLINENILTGDIHENIGTTIQQNVGTISIFTNRVNQLNQNTGSASIGANSSDEIFNNVFNNSTIYSNTVKMINTNTVNNSLSFNVGHSISSNTASNIDYNSVLEVENNILGTFSYNIGSEFKFNSITQSSHSSFVSFTNKNLTSFDNKVNFGTVSLDNSVPKILVWDASSGNVLYNDNISSSISQAYFITSDINTSSYFASFSTAPREYFGVSNSSTTYFNLPPFSLTSDGKILTIKDESGLSSVNPIVIQAGTFSIDGMTQSTLAIDFGSLTLLKKSNGWWII